MIFNNAKFGIKPSRNYTNNLRLIKLAVDLQRCARQCLNNRSRPATRITSKSLEQSYWDSEFARSTEAASKMARRDLQYMKTNFGLAGCEDSGYYMHESFPRYKHMFEYWLKQLDPSPKTDARLHVMLDGLITAIENGLRSDPIAIPDLASELKKKYGKKNIRDTKRPLQELFSDNTISSYLAISELDEDIEDDLDGDGLMPDNIVVLRENDPILLRLKSRNEVGDNNDISINLALPGRVRNLLEIHCSNFSADDKHKVRYIATAVAESHCWQDSRGEQFVPYILYREGKEGPFMLTLWNYQTGEYHDVLLNDIESIPESIAETFTPYGVSMPMWKQLQDLTS